MSRPFLMHQPSIRSFVTEHLAEEVRVDLTKKQVARNGVGWTIGLLRSEEPANRVEGVAEVEIRGGKIKTLRLSAW